MNKPAFFKNKKVMFPIYALIIFALAGTGLASLKKPPEKKDDDKKTPLVSVRAVDVSPLQLNVSSQGIFSPKYETRLVAQVSGEIVSLSNTFVRGGIVKKGELLAQIDPFDYEVKLEDARANLASAQAALALEKAQGKVAEAEWEKIRDTSPTALSLRKPQLEQAVARVSAAEAGVKQAAKDLERTRIIAPFDALVSERSISLGSFAGVGTNIGHLLDVSSGEVRLPIPSRELQYLAHGGVGADVDLIADIAGASHSWRATIARSEGIIDEASRMVYLVAEMADPYGVRDDSQQPADQPGLPFGAYVSAEITGIALESAAILPRHLVNNEKVAVYEDHKLTFKSVSIARVNGANVVVTGGLTSGEQLVTSALDFPVEGMALEAIVPTVTPADNQDTVAGSDASAEAVAEVK